MDDPPAEQPQPACDIFGNSDSELSADEGDLKVAGLDRIPIQESDRDDKEPDAEADYEAALHAAESFLFNNSKLVDISQCKIVKGRGPLPKTCAQDFSIAPSITMTELDSSSPSSTSPQPSDTSATVDNPVPHPQMFNYEPGNITRWNNQIRRDEPSESINWSEKYVMCAWASPFNGLSLAHRQFTPYLSTLKAL